MAKDKLTEYSATNASNDVIGDISVAEGMLPSAVNNALREQMTHLKNFSDGTDAIDALAVDNLKLDGNTISSTDTNGNVNIDPDGTGETVIDSSVRITKTSGAPTLLLTDNDTSGDGTIDASDGNLRFYSDNDGEVAGSLMGFYVDGSEAMRLTSGGNLNIGKTADGIGTAGLALRGDVDVAQFTRSGGEALEINRLANDGNLVIFYQAGTAEGNISVSGTTVSYNGGHLARWSQATDGNRITGLVKGTVMTNLDQMAVWTKDGVTEDNEQLNCMAVSSVEGDANVAGVFVNYDDDDTDHTADMNIAMTGDMVIRIASGTTVARGDLLMSAGDGTAKPQGDDIVRSKTIAKVTSTTVSHTYDDGTFLVPCVLMAC